MRSHARQNATATSLIGSSVEIDVNPAGGVVRSEQLREFLSGHLNLAKIHRMARPRTVFFSVVDSPVGPLLIAATDRGLRCLQFHRGRHPRPPEGEVWLESREQVRPYEQQISAYFRGELRKFTFKLDLAGTAFQKDCWQALLRIPYGNTRTYADIAREIGRPHAFRAVGQANHDNPIAIVVPCHRVLGANGTLTGYGGGLSTKEKLLRLEGATFRVAQPSAKRAKDEKRAPERQARFDYGT